MEGFVSPLGELFLNEFRDTTCSVQNSSLRSSMPVPSFVQFPYADTKDSLFRYVLAFMRWFCFTCYSNERFFKVILSHTLYLHVLWAFAVYIYNSCRCWIIGCETPQDPVSVNLTRTTQVWDSDHLDGDLPYLSPWGRMPLVNGWSGFRLLPTRFFSISPSTSASHWGVNSKRGEESRGNRGKRQAVPVSSRQNTVGSTWQALACRVPLLVRHAGRGDFQAVCSPEQRACGKWHVLNVGSHWKQWKLLSVEKVRLTSLRFVKVQDLLDSGEAALLCIQRQSLKIRP